MKLRTIWPLGLLLAVGLLAPAQAQTIINGDRTILGNWDASISVSSKPYKVGLIAARPATCEVGQAYFATDATAGLNEFVCTATDVWSQAGTGAANYYQAFSGTSVVLTHGMGNKNLILACYDSSGTYTEPGYWAISLTTPYDITVNFQDTLTGFCVVNGHGAGPAFGGGGGVDGNGTVGTIALFAATTTVGDSKISQTATLIEVIDRNLALENVDNIARKIIFLEPSTSGANTTSFEAVAQSLDARYQLPAARPSGTCKFLTATDASPSVLSWSTGCNTSLTGCLFYVDSDGVGHETGICQPGGPGTPLTIGSGEIHLDGDGDGTEAILTQDDAVGFQVDANGDGTPDMTVGTDGTIGHGLAGAFLGTSAAPWNAWLEEIRSAVDVDFHTGGLLRLEITSTGDIAFHSVPTIVFDGADLSTIDVVTANSFVGPLTGNADTATLASSASDLTCTDCIGGTEIAVLADADVSDTLTASLVVGSGSTTGAVDLATAEVAGTLPAASVGTGLTDAQVVDTITASSYTPLAGASTNDMDWTTCVNDLACADICDQTCFTIHRLTGIVDFTGSGFTGFQTPNISLRIGANTGQFLAASLSASRAWTFPNATGTVVLKDTVDVLTNKTVVVTSCADTAAAATLTADSCNKVTVTGTTTAVTTINTCNAGSNGRVLYLLCGSGYTGVITDGSNLKLVGNFTCAANGLLSMMCNGTNWLEIARSNPG